MEKLDLTKRYKTYFSAVSEPEIVQIEPAQFISLTGKGDPSDEAFTQHIKALYITAYTIKARFKTEGKDFAVSKLEGLWWFDEDRFGRPAIWEAPGKIPRSEWGYRLLIRLPEYVTENDVKSAVKAAFRKKRLPLIHNVEFCCLHEGKCVQMLHVGPFATELETLKEITSVIQEQGFAKNGLHHEIYLSDFRRTAPDKLKTILREPVR
ncbi:hypothetical protein C7T94_02205 [Pedobacter yulinensis]|uniref:GyrI-like small molecule binding domain-containing protein n=1 Tax=Pedobacter yulinensis TaxID=2126353 RepID=A0A2T3HR69_9SPHI|nr:GyrI-like domain-containing protein [Pedobacter yulinensis]PST84954.1 hypothetical protein C7T94_02205 [Pedobacter yulinensis]